MNCEQLFEQTSERMFERTLKEHFKERKRQI